MMIHQVAELQKALHTKEEKLRGMRLAVVRLKEEFIKAEEQRAGLVERADADKENRHREHQEQMVDQVRAMNDSLVPPQPL